MVIPMLAEDRWSRECGECGWVDPDASYPTRDLAEQKVYAGQLPRCPECGSLDMAAILVSDPPAA
jgi:ribosomal protein S27AE